MNEDYRDFLAALLAEQVRFLVGVQFGLPPNRIDILTGVSGLTFEHAWSRRTEALVGGVAVPVLGLEDLLANKQASGRDKDRADMHGLKGRGHGT